MAQPSVENQPTGAAREGDATLPPGPVAGNPLRVRACAEHPCETELAGYPDAHLAHSAPRATLPLLDGDASRVRARKPPATGSLHAELKDSALAHLPSAVFAGNAA